MKIPIRRLVLSAGLLSAVGSIPLNAQSIGREISVAGGAMQFDASGTGTALITALRASTPVLQRWMLAEGSISFASMHEQFADAGTRVGVAEGQLQFQVPFARVRPYVGIGAGWLHYFNNASGRATVPTFSAATGLRVAVSRRVGVRGELRVRGWNFRHDQFGTNFGRSAAEWTGGLTYSF